MTTDPRMEQQRRQDRREVWRAIWHALRWHQIEVDRSKIALVCSCGAIIAGPYLEILMSDD